MTALWLESAAAEFEPPPDDAFAVLGYEPICLPRHEARKRGDAVLPEPCGKCPQELFHTATEDDVLYGGSAGGGKTAAICADSLRLCVKYPGIRVLILRRSYDELAESIYPEFQRFGWGEALQGRWNKTGKEITFPSRSLIRLRYMETLDDASRRQGGAYQAVYVDERTLLAPGIVDVIALERLRSAHGVPVIGIRSTSNPGGPSHGEVRAKYVDPTEHGRKVITNEHGLTIRFIPAKATDNPFLDEAYFRRLDAIPDPARRAAMRDGDWGQFSGQIFQELRWDRHVIEPFTIPPSWRRYTATDWGFTAPFANLWGCLDEDGRAYVYRELYETGVGEAEQARSILAAEAGDEQISIRLADDAMWASRGGDVLSLADAYAAEGVHLTPAGKGPGSRIAGWQRIHSYLGEAPACPMHRAKGWTTCPKIHFFSTCPKMWWELENLPYARKGNVEDSDPAAPDHLADCLRYWLVNIGTGPSYPVFDDTSKPNPADALGEFTHMGPSMVMVPSAGEPSDPLYEIPDDDAPVHATGQPSPFV
jgi:terminase large subunit-like protein